MNESKFGASRAAILKFGAHVACERDFKTMIVRVNRTIRRQHNEGDRRVPPAASSPRLTYTVVRTVKYHECAPPRRVRTVVYFVMPHTNPSSFLTFVESGNRYVTLL